MKIKLENSKGIIDKLENLKTANINQALEKSAALVEASAKENLVNGGHVRTGDLLRSISYRVEGDAAEVYTNVPYAPYVEFGTGFYSEEGNGREGWWVYVDESCEAPESTVRNNYTYEEACRVWHILASKYGADNVYITNGQKPTRFLRSALEDNTTKILEIFKEELC